MAYTYNFFNLKMYQIIKLIGRGANGDVFLAIKKEDNSTQVIKRLKIRDISEKERATIQTELKLLKQFKHINIVPFRDSFIDPQGNLNIVMAYCEGGDMHNLIEEAEGKKFEQKKIIEWVIQLALSIFYLHERRVLHRDIKTQNIFLTNGKVMLGDFGVSKVLDQAVDLAVTNIGTPYYMSPQQYRQKPYNYKSDIWAFGCIIYQMCSHKHVFEALTLPSLAVKVMKGLYAPISEQYSKQLRGLVGEMLKQNPKDRPSIREILTKPFLFGKVQAYMKKIYSEKEKHEPQIIKSLQDQASSLGFTLEEEKVKKEEVKGKKDANENKSGLSTKEKLKQESQKKYEKLSQKLKKQIQQRNRAQEQLKRIQREKNQKKKNDRAQKQKQKYSIQKPKQKQSKGRREDTNTTDRSSRTKISLDEISRTQPVSDKKAKQQEKEQKQENRNFKIQEQYDMDYEQYSDGEDKMEKIYEEDEEEEKVQKQPQKQQKKLAQKQKVELNIRKTGKLEPIQKIQKSQIKQVFSDEKSKLIQLQKEVKQKTIIISSIRNQISKLDFVISSDSQISDKEQRVFNPAYTRISEKINDLKQKIIGPLSRNGYTTFLDFIRANIGKVERNKVIQMIGEQNIGLWLIAENIVKLDKVLSKVPAYLEK